VRDLNVRYPGQLIDIGGRRLHAQLMGEGAPGVVLEAGFPGAGTSLDWGLVLPAISRFTTVIAYDRAGLGSSDPGPLPRSAASITSDLSALLARVRLPRPLVLVGHSGGGIIVREFCVSSGEAVAGVVLVDSSHEEQRERLPSTSRELQQMRRLLLVARALGRVGLLSAVVRMLGRRLLTPVHRQLPVPNQELRLGLFADTKNVEGALAELRAVPDVVRGPPPKLGDVPLIALSAERHRVQGWDELQRELASCSTRGTRRTVAGAGHYIQIESPEAVVDAVRELVDGQRSA
jgi:pimeloyl-ACP methyl ester carboxylesterase